MIAALEQNKLFFSAAELGQNEVLVLAILLANFICQIWDMKILSQIAGNARSVQLNT